MALSGKYDCPMDLTRLSMRARMRGLLAIALAMGMALALQAADVAGSWKGSLTTQAGNMDVTITMQPGERIAGKVVVGEYEGVIEKGTLAGEKLSFVAKFDPGLVTYEGTVTGDEMRLQVTGTQGDKYTLLCKRQK